MLLNRTTNILKINPHFTRHGFRVDVRGSRCFTSVGVWKRRFKRNWGKGMRYQDTVVGETDIPWLRLHDEKRYQE